MTDYFQRFKDLKSTIQEKIEEEKKPLKYRIHFNNSDIFLDDKKAVTLPREEHPNLIGILDKKDNNGIIYAGCNCHIYRLVVEDKKMQLTDSIGLNTNITDILPIASRNDRTVIVCGTECPHDGLRLLDFDNSNNSGEIITRGHEVAKGIPKFWFNHEKICINLFYQDHSGMQLIDELNPYLKSRKVDIKKTIQLCRKFHILG